jgi:hypothetical protein
MTDMAGHEVILEKGVWEHHCVAQHPEVRAFLDRIPEVVSRPNLLIASPTMGTTLIYYRLGAAEPRYRFLYLAVVVRYDSAPARVVTVYLTDSPSGSGRLLHYAR